jgi:hypothetical protein
MYTNLFRLLGCGLLLLVLEGCQQSMDWTTLDYAGIACQGNPSAPGCTYKGEDAISALGKSKGR